MAVYQPFSVQRYSKTSMLRYHMNYENHYNNSPRSNEAPTPLHIFIQRYMYLRHMCHIQTTQRPIAHKQSA